MLRYMQMMRGDLANDSREPSFLERNGATNLNGLSAENQQVSGYGISESLGKPRQLTYGGATNVINLRSHFGSSDV